MRRVSIPRPFAGGCRTDVPDYALELNQASYAQDLIAPVSIAQQRRGWEFRGSAVVSPTIYEEFRLTGVARTSFSIPDVARTVVSGLVYVYGTDYARPAIFTTDESGGSSFMVWRSASAYVQNPVEFIPRCVYNGDLIFCAQDGETPLIRYAGSSESSSSVSSGVGVSMAAKSQTISLGTGTKAASKGSFISVNLVDMSTTALANNPSISSRVISTATSNTYTAQSLRNTSSVTSSGSGRIAVSPVGYAFPAVSVTETGTVTTSAGFSASFSGLDPNIGIATSFPNADALLVINPNTGDPHTIADFASSTTLVSPVPSYTSAAFKILRRCPFKDATVHRGSLYGTGVKQYPARVYVFGPSDDIGIPPGAVVPYDPTRQAGYQNATVTGFVRVNDFVCGAYDVPGPYDPAPVVAIVSSSGPLLALKTDTVYGIYGTYDHSNPSSLEVTKLAEGSGCIDLRAAVSNGGVPYWAGEDGIFTYRNGAIVSLTDGKISREWQSLMRGYVPGTSVVSLGVTGNYLVASCKQLNTDKTGGAKNGPDTSNPDKRTFIYDLRSNTWLGRVSNFSPIQMWSVEIEELAASLYASDISDSTKWSRVIDFAPALFDGVNSADGDGTYPRLKAWTGTSIAQADGVEGETRLCDLNMHTNIYDSSGTASSLAVSVASSDPLDANPGTKTLSPIAGDTSDGVSRSKRQVNRTGRQHQIRVDLSTTSSNNKKTDIPEFVISFRDSRRGT